MLCEVIKEVITRRGTFRPGEVIDIPDAVVQKLGGKVRRIVDTPDTIHRLIDEALAAIDATRPDWTGWGRSLTDEQRRRLRDREAAVDAACLAGDRLRLTAALAEYRATILNELV